ncbi:MAG: DUF4268 domain-containing protein [Desulfitobacteriaceae bacterium]|nr:DUF4268 domain-containing protein [Desulfitobacteriaceae bacterium]
MFVLDKESNKITKVESKTFHDFGFKEREHLQEWIAKSPECLGEKLLIIQKEFDGFNDTNERLDLLALDKSGTIVVIENKLDDTGKDVTWQALKYVSYCSTLSKQQIKEIYQAYLDKYSPSENAEEKIVDFFNGKPFSEILLNENDQRMILVAGKFRKEVTSTVMWMLNHGIKVQCIKVTPYEYNKQILLDMEQIIPVKEAEDYIIKMADKTREEKEVKEANRDILELRKIFWIELLEKFNTCSPQFKNVNASTDHWLSSGSGVSGAPFSFIVTKNYAAVEVLINIGSKEENEKLYDKLFQNKEDIEHSYGEPLTWERLDDKKSARITHRMFGVDVTNREDWDKIKDFLCDAMVKFEKALKEPLKKAASSK